MRLALALLLLAGAALAQDEPLPCSRAVRAELKRIERASGWGTFESACADGRLATISVPTDAPIARKFSEFARTYPALFGLRASDLGPDLGDLGLPQLFAGVPIYRTAVGWRWYDNARVELHVRTRDTRGWRTAAKKPAIAAAAALAAAQPLWKDVGAPKRGLSARLMIAAGDLKCGEAKKPVLVWVVSGEREEDCLIRASDAAPCGVCWYDEASQERAER